VTGGPKATRSRRVMSCSDGPVEVGYVPVHSAPEVKDRPLVTLQTLGSSGQPTHRMCFDEAEAWELLASLHYVLGEEPTGTGERVIWRTALLHAIAAVERDYLDKRATQGAVDRIRALMSEQPTATKDESERVWVKLLPADGTFPCTGMNGCGQPANAALCDRFGNAFAFACCHSHLYGDLGHWRAVRAVLSMEGREPVFSHTVTGSAGGGGGAASAPKVDPATCDHPAVMAVDRYEYGAIVQRHCGVCGAEFTLSPTLGPPPGCSYCDRNEAWSPNASPKAPHSPTCPKVQPVGEPFYVCPCGREIYLTIGGGGGGGGPAEGTGVSGKV
jgi:hypothetical protein